MASELWRRLVLTMFEVIREESMFLLFTFAAWMWMLVLSLTLDIRQKTERSHCTWIWRLDINRVLCICIIMHAISPVHQRSALTWDTIALWFDTSSNLMRMWLLGLHSCLSLNVQYLVLGTLWASNNSVPPCTYWYTYAFPNKGT